MARIQDPNGEQATETVASEPVPQNRSEGIDKNPLGEEEITVRVRDGFEFYHMGELKRAGDPDFPMAISQARAASRMLDQVQPDGSLRAVPHEMQAVGEVPRANVAGMARHERIGAYEDEDRRLSEQIQQLTDRREKVKAALDHEQKAAAAAVNTQGPAANSPAFAPGTSGAPGTAAVPPRPGEPAVQAGQTPAANKGPIAQK
jgi:hypothetical protein